LTDETLAAGQAGPEVRDLQSSLAALGWSIDITGAYDVDTAKTVEEFQKAAGLPVNGVASPTTRRRIAEYLNCNRVDH